MKCLITGITGFVGSHLCDYLLTQNQEIYGLCRWRSPLDNVLHCLNKFTQVYGDLLDLSSLLKAVDEIKPDFIFHLAAQSYVPYSFIAPGITVQTNCQGTTNLLEAVRIVREKDPGYDPVVHICSSSEVYGQVRREEVPILESTPFRPASPYAVSKVCEDMLGYQYFLSYGIKTIRTRMFTHTGPRRGDVFVESTFAKQIVEVELGLRPPVVYVGNLDSIRTFADVRDTVRAYWLLVNKCVPGEVYNIGGDLTESVREMLKRLIVLSGVNNIQVEIDRSRLRPSDVTLQIPSSKKFKDATGWTPAISFDTTLTDLLQYWRNWYDRVNGKSVS